MGTSLQSQLRALWCSLNVAAHVVKFSFQFDDFLVKLEHVVLLLLEQLQLAGLVLQVLISLCMHECPAKLLKHAEAFLVEFTDSPDWKFDSATPSRESSERI